MKVSSFMVPKSKVISCTPEDYLEKAIKLMLEHVVGSVIVLTKEGTPAGIVTKTDLIRGWEKGLDAKTSRTVQGHSARVFGCHGRHGAFTATGQQYLGGRPDG